MVIWKWVLELLLYGVILVFIQWLLKPELFIDSSNDLMIIETIYAGLLNWLATVIWYMYGCVYIYIYIQVCTDIVW